MKSEQQEVTIKVLTSQDLPQFIELLHMFREVFEMNYEILPDEHLQKVLTSPTVSIIVAIVNGKVVGGLSGYELPNYFEEKPYAYVKDLAVATALQRRGIGSKLMIATKEHYIARGFHELYLQASMEDDYALNFYRSLKPNDEEDAVHFSYLPGK